VLKKTGKNALKLKQPAGGKPGGGGGGGGTATEIEEANARRAKLGLKPLK
jgi:hypothetical protein